MFGAWSKFAASNRQWLRVVTAEHLVVYWTPSTIAKMFEEASEVFDNMFKSSFPLTFIVFIPAVLILVSPLPAEAAHEFTVYRMQQYDLQGQPYGEPAALLLPYLNQTDLLVC